ncbi:expressed protein [Chlorella variabilis]|uniref:Expressed protein n=1 Tax=Chlorella variabilis TaxID=554065 RepID=E1ZGJ8_CHLVA|nr:expressed protein [Chlorella variabilis]EFN54770.1 expressed protein [Chlorella variabilis]|eukprot:XP_005846872.1 expressed protein [Chlorella variabilis]
MARSAVVVAVLLALSAPAVFGQGTSSINDLLNNAALKPFVSAVISIPECLSDSALLSFDVNECPSLLRMLDALSLGNTNPAVSCELSCVEQFAKLSETCFAELMDKFSSDTTNTGRLASAFFEECDALVADSTQAAPAPSPAAAEEVSEPESAPTPEPAVAEAPEPAPVPYSSAAGTLPKALLSLLSLAAAAFALLA